MERLIRETYMWAIALELVKRHHFQIFDPASVGEKALSDSLQQEKSAIFLFRNRGRKYEVIRLLTVDYVWPAMLSRDIRNFMDQVPLLRQKLRAANLTVENVYLLSSGDRHFFADVLGGMRKIEERKAVVYSSALFLDPHNLGQAEIRLPYCGVEKDVLTPAVNQLVYSHSLWELKNEVEREEVQKRKEFKRIFNYGRPVLTYLFILINILLFGLMEWVGSSTDVSTLITFGAKWKPALLEGEYWRLITPMFLHIGILHLFFNNIALYFLGGAMERIYGSLRSLWIYLLAGILGNVASFAFTVNVAAGASGSIFGCFGAMLYFGLKHRDLFFRTLGSDILIVLFLNLGIGAALPMIDNYAHVGGLLGGFLAAMMVSLPQRRIISERFMAVGLAVVVFALIMQVGFYQGLNSPKYHLIQAEIEISAGNWLEASKHLEEAIQLGDEQADTYFRLGRMYIEVEKYILAERMILQAQEKGIDHAELYFQLAYAQLQQDKLEEGLTNLLATMEREPMFVEAYYNLSLVYIHLHRLEKAIEVLERAEELNIATPEMKELHRELLESR